MMKVKQILSIDEINTFNSETQDFWNKGRDEQFLRELHKLNFPDHRISERIVTGLQKNSCCNTPWRVVVAVCLDCQEQLYLNAEVPI